MNIIEQTSSILSIPAAPAWAVGLGLVFAFFLLMAGIILNGYTLWLAARRGHKWWFVALFLVKSLGILEIIYFIVHRHPEKSPLDPSSWQ